ncbi:cyclodeaminase/cyclohydrolase family protein [Hujiaoplasma nucleasis]|uniref:Cyclodeaminase/cyclohydrolase family protein n=1 Tax=Hujiaoplasma nucleasis TaxID=2725268 RepID=A0A7L6N420_9MOLU|nr:cyclodeaminase/cyclohydrolase family protein [Hujiaoplasma nucleasis]QLY40923.1 cyclodeaminase/cyclohydrolase family protein [Hujiaoplasma nucleasis]
MKLIDMTVREFIDTLASDAVAPGGGSVSALSGANGAALIVMAGELTYNKKKFKELDEEIKKAYKDNVNFFSNAKSRFLKYVDEDTDAFNLIMSAFKMAKDTEAEKEKRSLEIQKATVETIRVPLEVCRLSLESMRKIADVMQYSNKNTISDQGVGVMMLHTALQGSAMNVLINLSGLHDQEQAQEYRRIVEDIKEEANTLRVSLLENVNL